MLQGNSGKLSVTLPFNESSVPVGERRCQRALSASAAAGRTSLGGPAMGRVSSTTNITPLHHMAASLNNSASVPSLSGSMKSKASVTSSPGKIRPSSSLSNAETARRKATTAMLSKHDMQAIEQLGDALNLEDGNHHGQLESLRLRCIALLRSKRNSEALRDADAALQLLTHGPASNQSESSSMMEGVSWASAPSEGAPSITLQAQIWQLRAIACSRCECHDEAAASFSRSLQLHLLHHIKGSSLSIDAMLEYFLDHAAKADAATLPFELYARHVDAPVARSFETPAFLIQLRPRFTPWPLEFTFPIVQPERANDALHSARVSFYCATIGMPSEPHLCVIHHMPQLGALVLLHARIDGVIEVVSISSEAARHLVQSTFVEHVNDRSLADFEILASGWERQARLVRVFESVVCERQRQWEEWRSNSAKQHHEAQRRRERSTADMLLLLDELGLAELGGLLTGNQIDLQTLQFLGLDDLERIGVEPQGVRLKLLGAVRSQAELRALRERIQELEKLQAEWVTSKEHATDAFKRERSQAERLQAKLATTTAELHAERERVVELSEAVRRLEDELAAATSTATTWELKANEFASDSDALQQRLKQVGEQQRHQVTSLYDELETRIDVALHQKKPIHALRQWETGRHSKNLGDLAWRRSLAMETWHLASERYASPTSRRPYSATGGGRMVRRATIH